MRIFLAIIFLVVSYSGLAQQAERDRQQIEDISVQERKSYQHRLVASQSNARTSASQNFNVTYYRCEWEVDPKIRHIKGRVTTHFVMTGSGSSISLDLANEHTVSLVSRSNVPLSFVHTNNTLTISFQAPIAEGVKDSVSISYAGVPPTAFGPFATGTHGPNQDPAIWTVSEPFGAKDWWPCKNGLDDKADSIDVYMTNPVNYKAVSNGLLQSETPSPDSKIITHWKHRYPIASYLVCFAVTNFNVLNNSVVIGGTTVPMQTHCYPESQASFANGAQTAMDAMVQFSSLLGDYPFKKEKYGHVQFMLGGGMEHQTCSFMVNMGNNLIAHELAHQWFGDKITCGNWEDIWLNEGFATHFANVFMENKFPANVLAYRTAEINSATSEPGGSVWVDNVSDPNRIFSQRLSYYKGSHLLYMLRWILSDAIFFTAVKNYLEDPALAYGFATTANLKIHLEAASGKDLTYFFNQWFTGQGYPSYKVEWFPDGNNVQVKLSQTTSHASVNFFQLPIPLMFRNTVTGEQKLVVLDNSTNGQVFLDNIGFQPNQVTFDPEKWLITKNNTITKVSDPLPVTFDAFSVACTGSQPQLNWSTSEEINADYFEVQKSSDAINWVTIGSVSASGNSKDTKNYTFVDESAISANQYYRIAEFDYDGTRQHSRILHAQCRSPEAPTLFISPNPVQDELHFKVDSDRRTSGDLQILDIQGRSVRSKSFSQITENRLNVSGLKSGLYILRIENSQTKAVKTARFLKQ